VADGGAHDVTADAVVVACGAFETPRLLLRSGIGNGSDLVGRYLMFHIQTIVLGNFPMRLHAYKGRDVTHLMDDPIVGDDRSATAARAVLGRQTSIGSNRGRPLERDGIPVIVTYHPSAALRDREAARQIRAAITDDLVAGWGLADR